MLRGVAGYSDRGSGNHIQRALRNAHPPWSGGDWASGMPCKGSNGAYSGVSLLVATLASVRMPTHLFR